MRVLTMAMTIATFALSMIATGCMSGGSGTIREKMAARPGVEERRSNWVDPCYPQRYSYQDRKLTLSPFAQQANNGHILDSTMMNYHFVEGKAELNAHGLEKLDQIVRRRPVADSQLYLQTARDIEYDAKNPNQYVAQRSTLNTQRVQAVQKYLSVQTADRGLAFNVQVIDPTDPAINADRPASAVRGLPGQYRSAVTGAVGTSLTGSGGGAASGGITAQPQAPASSGGNTGGSGSTGR